jgi:hypothetical protein
MTTALRGDYDAPGLRADARKVVQSRDRPAHGPDAHHHRERRLLSVPAHNDRAVVRGEDKTEILKRWPGHSFDSGR